MKKRIDSGCLSNNVKFSEVWTGFQVIPDQKASIKTLDSETLIYLDPELRQFTL